MKSAGREVAIVGAVTALVVTALDAALLELRRDFFTGGFLSVDSATTWGDRLTFLASSVAIDAVWASLGVLVAVALASRFHLGRIPRWCLALALGVAPLSVASLVEYQVFAHLGDAFDFGLMLDLVGSRPVELVAVASAHAFAPIAVGALAGAMALLAVIGLQRRFPAGVYTGRVGRLVVCWFVCALPVAAATTAIRIGSDVQDNGLRRKPAGQLLGAFVTMTTDVDRDGYGMLSRPSDPAPFDGRVYPYAMDIAGNGVDENGVGGDLPADVTEAVPTKPAPVFVRKPDVLLVLLESFRADLLGSRQGGREVTPVLNALAAAGAASSRAYSHNGYTVQSRYHLFTGRLESTSAGGSLIDDFRANGYETAYFSAQDESFGGAAYDVGAAGADVFYDARQDRDRRYTTFATAGSLGVAAEVVLERVRAFLAARDQTRPLFLYVNFYDTHFPYHHPGVAPIVTEVTVAQGEIVPEHAPALRLMYSNTAAHVDSAVGALLEDLTAHRGTAPATVVLADHGESLFDEGFLGHGYALNDVQTRIPLVARGLALEACEPVGQVAIRGAIVKALASPAAERRPSFGACDGQQVFQYLGTLDNPRQIALTSGSNRTIYDLRENVVRLGDGPWQPARDLDAEGRAKADALVHFWERVRMRARAAS